MQHYYVFLRLNNGVQHLISENLIFKEMLTEQANVIFCRAIDDYHRHDNVDTPIENPYAEGSLEFLLYHKNWIDTVQWHLEDIIRDPHIDPVDALNLKRRIDRSNQVRCDMVEYID